MNKKALKNMFKRHWDCNGSLTGKNAKRTLNKLSGSTEAALSNTGSNVMRITHFITVF